MTVIKIRSDVARSGVECCCGRAFFGGASGATQQKENFASSVWFSIIFQSFGNWNSIEKVCTQEISTVYQ